MLCLVIQGVVYVVRSLSNEGRRALRIGRFGKHDAYHVTQTKHGPECTCADFVMRREWRDPKGCKHIKAAKEWGLI